ncbi:4-oxalocrotonate tautomerase family protein [Campylobacter jejuni]|nr:2-hydroxymuconate tautomerase family protein [Campylobacter jejuni]EFP0986365.1 4-oxalocrotonate tautomerase family protein [Campylobacter jejuni]EGS5824152.1 4-oxalocrotonate tautomerase family protein [Campylobacter jejuni]EIB5735889.1 4-oxalocrotonate tautomerase family protein [Campylobacter jejuni]
MQPKSIILFFYGYILFFRRQEQKQELIAGVTDLLAKVLNKNKSSTVVIIDEIDTDNYGLGGKSITQARKEKS